MKQSLIMNQDCIHEDNVSILHWHEQIKLPRLYGRSRTHQLVPLQISFFWKISFVVMYSFTFICESLFILKCNSITIPTFYYSKDFRWDQVMVQPSIKKTIFLKYSFKIIHTVCNWVDFGWDQVAVQPSNWRLVSRQAA